MLNYFLYLYLHLETQKNKTMNLPKMVHRVKQIETMVLQGVISEYTALRGIFKYNHFLNQKLSMGMYKPCDRSGEVLNEPVEGTLNAHKQKYSRAKQRMLFKEVTDEQYDTIEGFRDMNFTIGDLLDMVLSPNTFELTLTNTGKRQAGIGYDEK